MAAVAAAGEEARGQVTVGSPAGHGWSTIKAERRDWGDFAIGCSTATREEVVK